MERNLTKREFHIKKRRNRTFSEWWKPNPIWLLKELKSIGTKKNTIEKRFRQGRKFKWKRFGENSTKTRLI
ncbi:hypothetical protein L596_011650 [Steinernema carpocapsae]|uniref:Uncharacterized protein n=1 Tax=Steinernema carpocapsae TaxID=34508 RepID=A0A4U5NVC5_STECR|nr:hypothetical protein L596_011650 [Steinernema carpocapsae]